MSALHTDFLFTHDKNLQRVTSVKSEEALVTEDFLCTVEAVLVHEFSHEGTRGALVLHARLHQVDGVHSCGSGRYGEHTVVTG